MLDINNDSLYKTFSINIENITNFKQATQEEIQWLDACIKANKFVSLEESKKNYQEESNPPFKIGDKVFLEKHYKTDLEIEDYSKGIPLDTDLIVKNISFTTNIYGNGSTKKWCVWFQDYFNGHPAEKFKPISELKSKQDNSLLEEAKKRYPIGTKFITAGNSKEIFIVKTDEFYWYISDTIANRNTNGLIYKNGKWAEIIEEPIKQDVKMYKYEVVNCTTQKEWDFVLSKNNPKNLSNSTFNYDGSENTCFIFKGNDTFGYCRLSYFENHNSRILSFEEWCKEFGYSFEKKTTNPDRTDNKNIASFGEYKTGDKIKVLVNGGNNTDHPSHKTNVNGGEIITIQSFEKNQNYIVAICEEECVIHLEQFPEKFSKISKQINYSCLNLEEWLNEVKKLNLSEKKLAEYIGESRYCDYKSVYCKLEGSNSDSKAKILFEKWNKEEWIPQVGDWVVFMPEKAKELSLYTECWNKPYVLKITRINDFSFRFSKEEMKRVGYETVGDCGNDRKCFRKAEPHEIPKSNEKVGLRQQITDNHIVPYNDHEVILNYTEPPSYVELKWNIHPDPLQKEFYDSVFNNQEPIIYSKKQNKKLITSIPEEKIVQFNKKSKKSNSIKCLTTK